VCCLVNVFYVERSFVYYVYIRLCSKIIMIKFTKIFVYMCVYVLHSILCEAVAVMRSDPFAAKLH